MNKVVTINLAGRAFGIEEAGYDALRAYLESAERSLGDNPDKTEILADIEAALAEKCATYLNAAKNVITKEEAETMVREMGPIAGSSNGASASTGAPGSPKRLYRLKEGQMLAGICNGLAAYFDIDVTLVRIVFVILTMLTSGAFLLAYFIMMLVIPEANTPEQRAASMGGIPTAQEIIDTVKKEYDRFSNSGEWHKWKHQMKAEKARLKHELRRQRWQWTHQYNYQYPYRSPFWDFMNSVLGLVWCVLIVWVCWWSYNHVAIAHDFFDHAGVLLREAGAWISQKI